MQARAYPKLVDCVDQRAIGPRKPARRPTKLTGTGRPDRRSARLTGSRVARAGRLDRDTAAEVGTDRVVCTFLDHTSGPHASAWTTDTV